MSIYEVNPDTGNLRAEILDEAKVLICGDRNSQYGPPAQDFRRTADVLNSLGYRGPGGRELEAHDVAVIISAVKLSRIMWSPGKRDHWVDLAGYAACGYECVTEEGKTGPVQAGKHLLSNAQLEQLITEFERRMLLNAKQNRGKP
jgi:Domain of unknown function (DUF6378)